ncbi:helix-turn-helix transcriptional regulator [Rhizobium sp. P40RR-XXII]|uniref:sulfite-sensing transcriptional repressor BigR n=1 Tax=Rhizobium sp. P40RR-XXII TaxID=2726739 RepID=UPI001456D952|nr:sulfite-sensing transcriptional repressor BigR [Rhizobium sp. P40RR-XXII]NLS17745.1 helix-turn-helix transcriptional regulator [Rhizobium sp. P40RR-XXII]
MVTEIEKSVLSAMSLEDMARRSAEVASLLRTLAHPMRLILACTLAEGEYSVSELEEKLGIHQPNLSQQLGVLREAGIVETRREAKQIFYRLTEEKAAQLIEALYSIFCLPEERS